MVMEYSNRITGKSQRLLVPLQDKSDNITCELNIFKKDMQFYHDANTNIIHMYIYIYNK